MSQLILTINDENKADLLFNFLNSLNYISVKIVDDEDVFLSDEQKRILDERRLNVEENDFIDWDIARQSLRFKK